jgi:hypothetical protein
MAVTSKSMLLPVVVLMIPTKAAMEHSVLARAHISPNKCPPTIEKMISKSRNVPEQCREISVAV